VRQLHLVLAQTHHEAHAFHEALLHAEFKSYISNGVVNAETFRTFGKHNSKFFVCTHKMSTANNMTHLGSVIAFRKMTNIHDFVELQTLTPRETHVCAEVSDTQLQVSHAIAKFMEPMTCNPNWVTRLELRQDFYQARRALQAVEPVNNIFDT